MSEKEEREQIICPDCGGDGKETCHNPDHGFIDSLPGGASVTLKQKRKAIIRQNKKAAKVRKIYGI